LIPCDGIYLAGFKSSAWYGYSYLFVLRRHVNHVAIHLWNLSFARFIISLG
jgi:hypothetical protein